MVSLLGMSGVGIAVLSAEDFRSGLMQSRDGIPGTRRYLVAPKYEEHDLYWFIDLGTWWSIFLECPNEYIDLIYEEIGENLL